MKDLRTVILAAGKGTRMKSDVPKVLHAVCGKPLIQYVLDVAKAVGSLKTYVVAGHKGRLVSAYLENASNKKDWVLVEQKKLLGTADAVKCVADQFKSYRGDVLVLCGDTPLLNKSNIRDVIRRHRKTKSACTFLTAVVHEPQGYGRILRDDSGRACIIREDKDAVGCERDIAEINVGVYCFDACELFKMLREIKLNAKKKEFYLTDIIELFSQKHLRIETIETQTPQEGLGINTREDLAVAEAVVRQRILSHLMLEGVTITDPSATYIHADVKIGRDTTIHPGTFIEKDVRIGKGCVIGPFARLRSGTRISDGVEIGNFTEISRTKIGSRTFMKHFSYLGDAVVGNNVNLGAGMITANFDGKDKNVTKIQDHAFIGSGAVLVAPVKIGNKAIVGAGSVVTKGKNIPDNAIAVGVPARVVKK